MAYPLVLFLISASRNLEFLKLGCCFKNEAEGWNWYPEYVILVWESAALKASICFNN